MGSGNDITGHEDDTPLGSAVFGAGSGERVERERFNLETSGMDGSLGGQNYGSSEENGRGRGGSSRRQAAVCAANGGFGSTKQTLQEEYWELEDESFWLVSEIEDIDTRIADIDAELEGLRTECAALDEHIADLQARQQMLHERYEQAKKAVGERNHLLGEMRKAETQYREDQKAVDNARENRLTAADADAEGGNVLGGARVWKDEQGRYYTGDTKNGETHYFDEEQQAALRCLDSEGKFTENDIQKLEQTAVASKQAHEDLVERFEAEGDVSEYFNWEQQLNQVNESLEAAVAQREQMQQRIDRLESQRETLVEQRDDYSQRLEKVQQRMAELDEQIKTMEKIQQGLDSYQTYYTENPEFQDKMLKAIEDGRVTQEEFEGISAGMPDSLKELIQGRLIAEGVMKSPGGARDTSPVAEQVRDGQGQKAAASVQEEFSRASGPEASREISPAPSQPAASGPKADIPGAGVLQ